MEQQVQRYVFGAAGAGFVLIWTTLGLRTAILAVVGALVATNCQRLIGIARGRRQRPARSRQRLVDASVNLSGYRGGSGSGAANWCACRG